MDEDGQRLNIGLNDVMQSWKSTIYLEYVRLLKIFWDNNLHMHFIFAWSECRVELFLLTIILEIDNNAFLSISPVCVVVQYTLYVGETLLAICQMIWWRSSPKSTPSQNFLSCVKTASCVRVCEQTVMNWQNKLFLASGPSILLKVEQINSNNNKQCICAHSTKKSITSGLLQHWHKYTWAISI